MYGKVTEVRRTIGAMIKIFAVTLLIAVTLNSGTCDSFGDAGRKLLDQWRDSILIVQITTKSTASYEGQPMTHEDKNEATAVVIDPSGLAVMSLSESSPEGMLSQFVDGQGAPKLTSEITDMKLIMPDGKQIPYKIVLRDKDMDLAFIRPADKTPRTFKALDLTKASKPGVFDQVIYIDRLPVMASRSIGAFSARINAVVQKPRTFYVLSAQGLGAPVFTEDGGIVGIVVIRGSQGVRSIRGAGYLLIVLPASDVLNAAKQALQSTP